MELKTDIIVSIHSVYSEIIRYAENENVDPIVVRTLGSIGLTRLLLDRVASRVVRYICFMHCYGCKGFKELDERGFCIGIWSKDKKHCRGD